jgi:transcriptional regulator with XRE-family HTH domain
VTEQPVPGFGEVLRRLRAEARLTQEELAEAAGLSPRTVSDLERGVKRTAHKDTAGLLADALSLTGPVRGVFVAAARGQVPAAEVLAVRAEALAASAGNLPVQPSSFVGRAAELAELATAMWQVSFQV